MNYFRENGSGKRFLVVGIRNSYLFQRNIIREIFLLLVSLGNFFLLVGIGKIELSRRNFIKGLFLLVCVEKSKVFQKNLIGELLLVIGVRNFFLLDGILKSELS